MAKDLNYRNTVLLMHGDEAGDPYGNYLAVGASGKSPTPEIGTNSSIISPGTFAGRPSYSLAGTNYAGAYGTTTGLFDADFTVEFWAYFPSTPTTGGLISATVDGAGTSYPALDAYFYTGSYVFYVRGSSPGAMTFAFAESLNTWHHYAIQSSGGIVSIYIDGVRKANVAIANNTSFTTVNGMRFGYFSGVVSASATCYTSDLRVYKGVAKYAGASFTVPTWPMPPYSSVIDSSPLARRLLTYGSAAAPYTAEKKYGGGCMSFDGASYLELPASADWNFGTGDFTIEAWVFRQNSGVWQALVGQWNNTTDLAWSMHVSTSNTLCFLVKNATTDFFLSTGASYQFPLNAWAHCAVVRRNGTLGLYIDGVLMASRADLAGIAVGVSTTIVRIGRSVAVTDWFTGCMDDIRITKGVARYTADFTPPDAAFPDGQAVVSGTVRDINNVPCQRRVFVHARASGRLLGSADSDPTTGTFEIAATEDCYAVVLDSTGTYNALVLDRLTPAL